MGPRHTSIRQIGSSRGQYLLICSLNMGMCSQKTGYPSVKIKAKGAFFRCRLSMKINKYRKKLRILKYFISLPERAIYHRHENPSLKIYYHNLFPILFKNSITSTRTHWWIIGRSENMCFRIKDRDEIFLIPYMIA